MDVATKTDIILLNKMIKITFASIGTHCLWCSVAICLSKYSQLCRFRNLLL